MSSFGSKCWWNDETYKAQLTVRADSGSWHVVADGVPGRVIKIVYAGYKIQLPNNSEVIVNPDFLGDALKDVSVDDYPVYVSAWQAKEDERLKGIRDAETARLAKLEEQRQCLHPSCVTYTVVKAAGCDIDDTYCDVCDKIMRRSWSTASDRDPDDHISDWAWWEREYQRLYQATPNRADYKVVETMEDEYPNFMRRPKPSAT